MIEGGARELSLRRRRGPGEGGAGGPPDRELLGAAALVGEREQAGGELVEGVIEAGIEGAWASAGDAGGERRDPLEAAAAGERGGALRAEVEIEGEGGRGIAMDGGEELIEGAQPGGAAVEAGEGRGIVVGRARPGEGIVGGGAEALERGLALGQPLRRAEQGAAR